MAIKVSDELITTESYLNTLSELDVENKQSGFNDSDQSFIAWLNREIWDHDDEMIKADGWDLSVFDTNPVVMWAHDYTNKPLGLSQWTKRKTKENPAGLMWRPEFTKETQEGIETYKLYKARILRGFSAGFKPLDIDRKADKKGRPIYTKTLLLEGSAVPIPANFMSLTLALENDFITSKILQKGFDDILSKTDSKLFQTNMEDQEFEYIEKSFGKIKQRKKFIEKIEFPPEIQTLIDDMQSRIKTLEDRLITEHDQATFEGVGETFEIDDEDTFIFTESDPETFRIEI